MATDYTTTLNVILDRAIDNIIETIAKEGLTALKHVIDDAGFGESEYLKNYEVFAHVEGKIVIFEIIVDFEALDEETAAKADNRPAPFSRIRSNAKKFALMADGRPGRVSQMKDARVPADDKRNKIHDARRGARRVGDARKGAEERLAEHVFAANAPRGISITKEGKMSIALQKVVRQTERGVRFPQSDFEGVVKEFIDRLQDVIARNFVPELDAILARML